MQTVSYEADGFLREYLIPEVVQSNTLSLTDVQAALREYNLAHNLALNLGDLSVVLKGRVVEHYQPGNLNPETLVRIYTLLADIGAWND